MKDRGVQQQSTDWFLICHWFTIRPFQFELLLQGNHQARLQVCRSNWNWKWSIFGNNYILRTNGKWQLSDFITTYAYIYQGPRQSVRTECLNNRGFIVLVRRSAAPGALEWCKGSVQRVSGRRWSSEMQRVMMFHWTGLIQINSRTNTQLGVNELCKRTNRRTKELWAVLYPNIPLIIPLSRLAGARSCATKSNIYTTRKYAQ